MKSFIISLALLLFVCSTWSMDVCYDTFHESAQWRAKGRFLCSSKDGRRLAVQSEQGFVKVFNFESGKEICRMHALSVKNASFSSDESQLLFCCTLEPDVNLVLNIP